MYKNGARMMAWIAKIAEVSTIPNADAICSYRVGGWWVVDKKDAYNVGDLCIYVSIDSWIPHDLAPFLSKGSQPREFNGVKGERLRTVKLRGCGTRCRNYLTRRNTLDNCNQNHHQSCCSSNQTDS